MLLVKSKLNNVRGGNNYKFNVKVNGRMDRLVYNKNITMTRFQTILSI